ncbi:MAG: DUF805 domain-containing protein [Nevskia sp.]|nr:DUF805 domain-containing protein [Nevskia sp.]
MNWYVEVLKKYAVFDGRAGRTEFWMYTLINFVVSLVVGAVGSAIHLHVLGMIYGLAVLLPGIGVAIRRLHDTNRSGWWLLLSLVPVIGVIVLIVFFAMESDAGGNQYGPNPNVAVASGAQGPVT